MHAETKGEHSHPHILIMQTATLDHFLNSLNSFERISVSLYSVIDTDSSSSIGKSLC